MKIARCKRRSRAPFFVLACWVLPSAGMAGPLNTPRSEATATKLSNGKVLVAGGSGADGSILAGAELFDPATGNFSATGNMTTARFDHTATRLSDGRVLVTGGSAGAKGLASAEIYNPSTGMFTAVADMALARVNHLAILLNNGKVLVSGGVGENGAGHLAGCEVFDPTSGAWSATGAMTIGKSEHPGLVLSNGKVFVCGGLGGADGLSAGRKTEQYDPALGTWTALGDMIGDRGRHVAVMLNSGKVFISGETTSELFDPGNGSFTAVPGTLPPADTLREGHGAVRLLTGDVFAYGGALGKFADGFSSIQYRYNTSSNTYTTLSPTVADADRTACPVVLLDDGRALIIGGGNSVNGPFGTAILFDPSTNTFSIP